MRDSTVVYRSFWEAVRDLPCEEYKAAMEALLAYALDGVDIAETATAKMFLTMAKPQVDKNNQRYENGKRGGRPKNQKETKQKPNENQTKPNENQTEPKAKKAKPNVNVNVNVNVKDIIHYLNEKTGAHYQEGSESTRRLISGRLREGYTVDDFKRVIDRKYAEWGGTDMAQYLRPQTLFGTKFEAYLNAPEAKRKSVAGQFGFSGQRDYNMDELERQLLEKGARA